MKKLTKKEKAMFPEYIMHVDLTTKGNEAFEGSHGYERGFYTNALTEKDIISAMKKAELFISNFAEETYLVDLLGKTGREDEDGRPIYEIKLRTRTHLTEWKNEDGRREAQTPQWHICDEAHCESNEFDYKWYMDISYLEFGAKGVA